MGAMGHGGKGAVALRLGGVTDLVGLAKKVRFSFHHGPAFCTNCQKVSRENGT